MTFMGGCAHQYDERTYKLFLAAFNRLPLATRCNGRVLVLHAGVDTELNLDAIQSVDRAAFAIRIGGNLRKMSMLGRPGVGPVVKRALDEESCKRVTGMLWNDPTPKPFTGLAPNVSRGVGQCFGHDVVDKFLSRHPGLELVIRSHEQVGEGYLWPFGEAGRLVTLFSASN